MGLIGLIIAELIGIILGIINGSYGFLGVILTIMARMKLKKD